MGVTAGSRFNAARRIHSVDRSFNYMLSAVSVAVIALTVLPYVYDLSVSDSRLVALFTIAASIAILVLTNIKYGNRDLVIAEQLHRCALEINEVARRLDSEDQTPEGDLYRKYSDEYSAILQKYSVNHEKCDFLEHKLSRKGEYANEYEGTRGYIRALVQQWHVTWSHNAVWLIGVPVLVLCGWIVARTVL